MKSKIIKSIIAFAIMCSTLINLVPCYAVQEFNMSDKDFFEGFIDAEGKLHHVLDYDYSPDLEPVKEAVDKGDYETAKEELLTYYRNRSIDLPEPNSKTYDHDKSRLLMDNIFSRDTYLTDFKVGTEEKYYEADVRNTIKSQIPTGALSITFMLMGRYKDDAAANFNSRETGENVPTLRVMASGKEYIIKASKDTFIRACDYGDENYGDSVYLSIRETGSPMDNNSMRSFVEFDLSKIPMDSEVTSATLSLYGSYDSIEGEMTVMVFTYTPMPNEMTYTWNGAKLNTYSYPMEDGLGFDFIKPDYCNGEYMNVVQRFEMLLPLFNEYLATNDEAYIEAAYDILDSFLSIISSDRSLDMAYRVIAIPNMILRTINSKSLTAERFTEYMKHFWYTADFLNLRDTFWTGRSDTNWGTTQSLGMAMIAVMFPEFADAEAWLDEIDVRYDYQVNTLIQEDGSYNEATHGYMSGVVERMTKYMSITNGTRTLTDDFKAQVTKLFYYHLNMIEPNSYTSSWGDAASYNVNVTLDEMTEWANTYGYDDLLYVGTRGEEGTAPLFTSVFYPIAQAAYMRTGWTKDDLYMFVPFRKGGSHAHNDALGMNLYAYGRELLVHTKEVSYTRGDPIAEWQRYRKEAHNTVEVDDASIWVARNSADREEITTEGDMTINNSYDLFRGRYTESPDPNDDTSKYKDYTKYDHDRSILFVKPKNFWIVSDRVTAYDDEEHTYSQSWHMATAASPELRDDKSVASRYVSTGNLHIIPADPEEITHSFEKGYIGAAESKFTQYTKKQAGDVTFDTVLYPTPQGEVSEATVSRIELDADTTEKTAISIDFGGEEGYYYNAYENDGSLSKFAQFETDADTAYIHKGTTGDTTTISMYGGTELYESGKKLVSSPNKIEDIGIVFGNGSLAIDSSEKNVKEFNNLTIYAPNVKTVTFNGDYTDFVSVNGYVTLGSALAEAAEYEGESRVMPSTFGFKVALNGAVTAGYAQNANAITIEASDTWNGDFGIETNQKEIAQGKDVLASSYFNEKYGMFVNNGDMNSSWIAETKDCPQEIVINLGEKKYMSYVDIFWDYMYSTFDTYRYSIYVSDDDENYTKVTNNIARTDFSREFINKTAHYIKIVVDESFMNENAAIKEIQVYSNDNAQINTELVNAVFTVGSRGDITSMSEPLSICIKDAADYGVGYVKDGAVYAVAQGTASGTLNENEMVYEKSGNDLVLLTKNAATFVLYGADSTVKTENSATSPGVTDKTDTGSGSSGGSGDSSGSSGNGGSGGGGGSGSIVNKGDKEETPTATEIPGENNKEETEINYTDIADSWAKDSIIAMSKKGIVNGMGDGIFAPDKTTTRAEFVAMLMRAAGVSAVPYRGQFKDVAEEDWYSSVIQAAFDSGILSGDGINAMPNKLISRQEAAKLIANAAQYFKLKNDSENSRAWQAEFTDCDKISDWAVDAFGMLIQNGIMGGYPDASIRPQNLLTRAEATVLIERLLKTE